MLSISCENMNCILSDWYEAESDYDRLTEKMHVANVSLKSACSYIEDFIYNIARKYYIYPIHREMIIYTAIPIDYFNVGWDRYIDRDAIQQYKYDALNRYIDEYGDDYVDLNDYSSRNADIGKELDMLLLEMDSIDEQNDELLEEHESDEEHENFEDDSELNNIDPEILNDPILMVKWLQKQNN
jgi:hypothetical protein